MLALLEIPEHGGAVLATRGAEGAVGGDSNAVEVASVSNEVGPELAAREVPHLDELVPTARNDQGVLSGGREADARHPLTVAILGVGRGADGVLAVTKGVPQLDGLRGRKKKYQKRNKRLPQTKRGELSQKAMCVLKMKHVPRE